MIILFFGTLPNYSSKIFYVLKKIYIRNMIVIEQ